MPWGGGLSDKARASVQLFGSAFESDLRYAFGILLANMPDPGHFPTMKSYLSATAEYFEGPAISAEEIAGSAPRHHADHEATITPQETARLMVIDMLRTKMVDRFQEAHGAEKSIEVTVFRRKGLTDGPDGGKAFDFIIYLDQDGYGYVVPTASDPAVPLGSVLYRKSGEVQIVNGQRLTEPSRVETLLAACDEENARRDASAKPISSTEAARRAAGGEAPKQSRQERRAAERKAAKEENKTKKK